MTALGDKMEGATLRDKNGNIVTGKRERKIKRRMAMFGYLCIFSHPFFRMFGLRGSLWIDRQDGPISMNLNHRSFIWVGYGRQRFLRQREKGL